MSATTLRYAQRAWRASRPPFDVNTGVTSEATSETIQRTKKSLRNAVAYPRSIPHPSFVISIHWAQVLGISNDQNVVADGPRLRRPAVATRLIPAKALASLLIGYVATKVALRT